MILTRTKHSSSYIFCTRFCFCANLKLKRNQRLQYFQLCFKVYYSMKVTPPKEVCLIELDEHNKLTTCMKDRATLRSVLLLWNRNQTWNKNTATTTKGSLITPSMSSQLVSRPHPHLFRKR